MESSAPQKSAFSRSVWDTSSLIFVGIGSILPPVSAFFTVLGLVMIWRSARWERWEQVFASVCAGVFSFATAACVVALDELGVWILALAFMGGPFVCFFMAFRMGRHDVVG